MSGARTFSIPRTFFGNRPHVIFQGHLLDEASDRSSPAVLGLLSLLHYLFSTSSEYTANFLHFPIQEKWIGHRTRLVLRQAQCPSARATFGTYLPILWRTIQPEGVGEILLRLPYTPGGVPFIHSPTLRPNIPYATGVCCFRGHGHRDIGIGLQVRVPSSFTSPDQKLFRQMNITFGQMDPNEFIHINSFQHRCLTEVIHPSLWLIWFHYAFRRNPKSHGFLYHRSEERSIGLGGH